MAGRKHWHVLKVRPTFEEVAARELRSRQFEVLLPENPQKSGRNGSTHNFLFPGHLLCRLDLADRQSVLSVPGVLCIVGVPRPMPMDDGDVRAIQTTALIPLPRKVVQRQTRPARRVRVLSGPLRGTRGEVFELDGRIQFGIDIQPIGKTLAFDAEEWSLRAMGNSPGTRAARSGRAHRPRQQHVRS